MARRAYSIRRMPRRRGSGSHREMASVVASSQAEALLTFATMQEAKGWHDPTLTWCGSATMDPTWKADDGKHDGRGRDWRLELVYSGNSTEDLFTSTYEAWS